MLQSAGETSLYLHALMRQQADGAPVEAVVPFVMQQPRILSIRENWVLLPEAGLTQLSYMPTQYVYPKTGSRSFVDHRVMGGRFTTANSTKSSVGAFPDTLFVVSPDGQIERVYQTSCKKQWAHITARYMAEGHRSRHHCAC